MTPSEEYTATMYDLKCNEWFRAGVVDVFRVPGGWIYKFDVTGGVFVPFSEEFRRGKYERNTESL